MKYLQVKNYRTLKDSILIFNKINLLLGDNNTGKTSLMKLIEALYNKKTLDFRNTYLYEYTFPDISFDSDMPVEIVMADLQKFNPKKENNKKKTESKEISIVEYIKINKFTEVKKCLIDEYIIFNSLDEKIFRFEIKYLDENVDKILVKQLNFTIYKLSEELKQVSKFTSSCNLMNFIKKNLDKKYFKKSFDFDFDYLKLSDDFNSSRKWQREINSSINKKVTKEENMLNWLNIAKYMFAIGDNDGLSINRLHDFIFYYDMTDPKFNVDFFPYFFPNLKNFSLIRKFTFFNSNDEIEYIKPIRNTFKRVYDQLELADKKLTDSRSLRILQTNPEIKIKVEEFLKESNMLNSIFIQTKNIDDNIYYIPKYTKKTNKHYKLFISGTGVSQILPILVDLFDFNLTKILIEQPEIHLHPKLQSLVGKVLFKWYEENFNQQDNQLFIETHSKYLIDSLRYEIYKKNFSFLEKEIKNLSLMEKSKKINKFKSDETLENINLLFFELQKNDSVNINNIFVQKNGQLHGELDNYMNFFIDESLKIFEI